MFGKIMTKAAGQTPPSNQEFEFVVFFLFFFSSLFSFRVFCGAFFDSFFCITFSPIKHSLNVVYDSRAQKSTYDTIAPGLWEFFVLVSEVRG